MAAMVFPTNPTVGQTYTVGSNTWSWTGTAWDSIATSNSLLGGSAGTIPYQSAANTTAMLPTGPSGQILRSNGAAAPSWTNTFGGVVASGGYVNGAPIVLSPGANTTQGGLSTDGLRLRLGWGPTLGMKDITPDAYSARLYNKSLHSAILMQGLAEGLSFNGTGFAGYTYYVSTNGATQYITSDATANGVVNIASSSTETLATLFGTMGSNGATFFSTITVTLIVQNGATPYYPTSIQIDGTTTNVTTRWAGGTAPSSGNANARDVYTFTIAKMPGVATYEIFASVTKFA